MYDTLRMVSVDLGQQRDPTAIAVVERGYVPAGPLYNAEYYHRGEWVHRAREPVSLEYHVRHLERPPLGTSYVDIVERILKLLESLEDKELVLAVDTTGVGRPVRDMLSEPFKTTHERKLRQIREQPRDRNASWMSSRRS